MKDKFLELVEEVKNTGIATILCNTTNAEELKAAWLKFIEENSELFQKVNDWASEYDGESLFEDGEEFENPIEIVVIIRLINDSEISECYIFDNYDDLTDAVGDIPEKFAERLADSIRGEMIYAITAEDIFDEDEEDDADEADGESDTADEEEGSLLDVVEE